MNQLSSVSSTREQALLVAEFNYIAQTAFQANEDRSRISNFYYVTAGAAIGAILTAKIEGGNTPGVYAGLSGLFLVLTSLGLLTLLQLARLRTAWEDSARAMNTIKDYCLKNSNLPGFEAVFLWRMETIPSGRNVNTIAFLLVLSILIISIATTAATITYATFSLYASAGRVPSFSEAIVLGAVAIFVGVVVAVAEYAQYEKWIQTATQKKVTYAQDHYAKFQQFLPEYPKKS